MNKYKLGEYEFDTYEELLAAEEDTKKIDVITSSMDVTDLEVALSLYEKIRNNEITFHSSVGSGFFMYLSDIVVAGARTMVEEEKEKENRLRKKRKTSIVYRVIGITLIACAAVIFSYIYRNDMAERRSEEELARVRKIQNLTGSGISDEEYSENVVEDNTALLNELRKQKEEAVNTDAETKPAGAEEVKKKLKILPDYQTLYAENTDFVGWISIEDTDIDYPVMQTEEAEGQFYLDHSFYRSSDKNGTLFMDVRNDFINRDTNLIIYGHNMKSGV
ncbi:MAG: class B sortase, partial [Lachnospiraceae bacterium]|nr:class B sortase [Lachnospiraceae bacterium]